MPKKSFPPIDPDYWPFATKPDPARQGRLIIAPPDPSEWYARNAPSSPESNKRRPLSGKRPGRHGTA